MDIRIVGIVVLILGLLLGVQTTRIAHLKLEIEHSKAERAQEDKERALVAAAATDKARKTEQKFNTDLQQAQKEAAQHEQNLRNDLNSVRAQRDGLLHDFAASRAAIPTASISSLRQRTSALEDVFEQCVREYSGVAEKADRHAADSLMLQKAWPHE